VTLLFKHGKARYVWVPGIALAWDLIITMTASYQKVFSSNVKIGFFSQRSAFQTAIDKGLLIKPAKNMDQMHQIVTNSTVDGVLLALFALLTLTVIVAAIPIWIKAAKLGGLPTTETPRVTSHIVAPSDFFATSDEKQAVREYEDSQRELAGSGRPR
jgi:carbon starvation protein